MSLRRFACLAKFVVCQSVGIPDRGWNRIMEELNSAADKLDAEKAAAR